MISPQILIGNITVPQLTQKGITRHPALDGQVKAIYQKGGEESSRHDCVPDCAMSDKASYVLLKIYRQSHVCV